ncbi:MAG: rhodanese-like domain-containing protein, partial [Deltaproteobacteria bacterium]
MAKTGSKTFKDIVAEARQAVPELSVDEVKALVGAVDPPLLVDVREKEEYRDGHLPEAISIPRGFLEMQVEEKLPDRSKAVVAYCQSGTRSLLAAQQLREMGYEQVSSMSGGYGAWKGAGNAWRQDFQFTQDQLNRYSRHFLLPEVGEEGQAKLLGARVLCIGAGGLGSP